MDDIRVAEMVDSSYENIVVKCPECCQQVTYNRASDLQTFQPIDGRNVLCLNSECQKTIRIAGDSANCAHEMLIYDCYKLLERKHYMNCILNLDQAYEMFFSLFLRVELLYKPFDAVPHQRLADLNRLLEELQKKIEKHTFGPMRALFLQHIVAGCSAKNLVESGALIAALPDHPQKPKETDIDGIHDAKLVLLLRKLRDTKINKLRNDVVHKNAYRPTRDEVEAAIEETRSILFPLTERLQLKSWMTP